MGCFNSHDDSEKLLGPQNDPYFKDKETEVQRGHKTRKWHIQN